MSSPCLHCRKVSKSIQVSCDDCNAFICEECHWCHEYQGNHEIRVCERCDSFYCRNCDEMECCTECGDVTCSNCSTFLNCKFCGVGLCEECATVCGRCGIVLCLKDRKFAVECHVCKMRYCLLCLASPGNGEVRECLRCNTKPSKRVEQLVHLRLKSIYKAFQSSSFSSDMNKTSISRGFDVDRDDLNLSSNQQTIEKQQNWTEADADKAMDSLLAELEEEAVQKQSKASKKKNKKKKGKKDTTSNPTTTHTTEKHISANSPKIEANKIQSNNITDHDSDEEELHFVVHKQQKRDDPADRLADAIENRDTLAIEELLEELKGVPGYAGARKNAKKALKKLQEERERDESTVNSQRSTAKNSVVSRSNTSNDEEDIKLAVEPSKLAIVSFHSNNAKTVCKMALNIKLIGWVIGKHGTKIRDIMDVTETRIWIDQDTPVDFEDSRMLQLAKTVTYRTMYITGTKINVLRAIDHIEQILLASPKYTKDEVSAKKSAEASTTSSANASSEIKKVVLEAEANVIPLLIGRKGRTIKNIQEVSGAKVSIQQNNHPITVTITANSLADVEKGRDMVEEILNTTLLDDEYSESRVSYDVDDSLSATLNASASMEDSYHNSTESAIKNNPTLVKPTVTPPTSVLPSHPTTVHPVIGTNTAKPQPPTISPTARSNIPLNAATGAEQRNTNIDIPLGTVAPVAPQTTPSGQPSFASDPPGLGDFSNLSTNGQMLGGSSHGRFDPWGSASAGLPNQNSFANSNSNVIGGANSSSAIGRNLNSVAGAIGSGFGSGGNAAIGSSLGGSSLLNGPNLNANVDALFSPEHFGDFLNMSFNGSNNNNSVHTHNMESGERGSGSRLGGLNFPAEQDDDLAKFLGLNNHQ